MASEGGDELYIENIVKGGYTLRRGVTRGDKVVMEKVAEANGVKMSRPKGFVEKDLEEELDEE